MRIIGVTMGCPAGIGPEIILRYFADPRKNTQNRDLRAIVVGDIGILKKTATLLGETEVDITPWQPGEKVSGGTTIPVMQVSTLDASSHCWGKPTRATAKAMAKYIETSVRLAQEGVFDGITTCPISKSSLNDAGYQFPGHTEMLASLTRSQDYAMMMAGDKLRVTLVTIHCPISDVAAMLTVDRVYDLIVTTHTALTRDFALSDPKIAVAGYNPHGGESTLFGTEEDEIIAPAITRAAQNSIDASGPYPPDTLFYKAAQGDFDAVVCMYHDQGLIPFKLLHFEDGVNVTLGLPIVRTSVDHGTAYDIAGKGIASHNSLHEAITMAALISKNRSLSPDNSSL